MGAASTIRGNGNAAATTRAKPLGCPPVDRFHVDLCAWRGVGADLYLEGDDAIIALATESTTIKSRPVRWIAAATWFAHFQLLTINFQLL